MHFSILFWNMYFLMSTKNILQFLCLLSRFFLSQQGNKSQWSTPRKAQPDPSEHSFFKGPANEPRSLLLSLKHFDTHLGLLSQVPILYSIQLLRVYKWCPGFNVINILKNKREVPNRNKLRVYYICHHESHISNYFTEEE